MRYLLSQIAAICGGELTGRDVEVQSVVTDSRSHSSMSSPSPLFVAIAGVNHDSHDYIEQMARQGVRAFVVEQYVTLPEGCSAVRVKSSIVALQALAAHHRNGYSGEVVAITGSNAKTIVKEWIAERMPSDVKFFCSPKSYNSQLGVALSILMLDYSAEVAIFEAGISLPNEMERIEQMLRPETVIFTSIGDAHQEGFRTIERKCREKMILARSARRVVYHSHYEPLATLIVSDFSDKELFDADECSEGVNIDISSDEMRRNAEIVATFFRVQGYAIDDFNSIPALAMRLEVKAGLYSSLLVDDAYSLDINSLALALDYLHTVAAGRKKTAIISDIAQSGTPHDELYQSLAQMLTTAGVDYVVGIGSQIGKYAHLFSCATEFYDNIEQAVVAISPSAIASRAVLIKGARKFGLERLSHSLSQSSHTTTLEVNLDSMRHNLNYFRSKMGADCRLMAMVKAHSYGMGGYEIAQMLQFEGVDYLGVAFVDEGVALRTRGITMPIVVLNADGESFDSMIAHRLEPEIYNMRSLHTFSQALALSGEMSYPIHLKLNTGMNRLGFSVEDLSQLIESLQELPALRIASIFSHLSCGDDPSQDEFTASQIALFDAMSSQIMEHLPYHPLRHIAASAAIERLPEAHFDMCRLGLGLYGYGEVSGAALQGVATLKTRIVQIKSLAPPQSVGYGREGALEREIRLATLPIGYADGLSRYLGCGRWSMMVNGASAPIVGRICMDSVMIDVTDCEGVQEGDEVVVFSSCEGHNISAMAKALSTIEYEVMTSLSQRIKRVYLKE